MNTNVTYIKPEIAPVDPLLTKVRDGLIKLASLKQVVDYSQLAMGLALQMRDREQREALSEALGTVTRQEAKDSRPMLSVLVVSKKTGMPGDGFFVLAEELGLKPRNQNYLNFFVYELERTFKAWTPAK